METVAHINATTPSVIIAPQNTGLPSFSLFIQRAINGLWVAWKPLMAPQAMVMKRHGKIGLFWTNGSVPSHAGFSLRLQEARLLHSSGKVGHLMNSPIISAPAIKSSEKAKRGYIFPIILSIGRSVAMMQQMKMRIIQNILPPTNEPELQMPSRIMAGLYTNTAPTIISSSTENTSITFLVLNMLCKMNKLKRKIKIHV